MLRWRRGMVAFMPTLVWYVVVWSLSSIPRSSITLGYTRVRVAWSSIIARPAMERSDLGYSRRTGHVRLNDWVNSVSP